MYLFWLKIQHNNLDKGPIYRVLGNAKNTISHKNKKENKTKNIFLINGNLQDWK